MKRPLHELVNDSVKIAHKGLDDYLFADQRKRKRKRQPSPPTEISGRCCGTCRNWVDLTEKDNPYGECQAAIVREGRYPESRVVITTKEARERGIVGGLHLRTTVAFAACSQYKVRGS